MYSSLSTLNTTTEVPLSKAPNPQLLPGRRSINGCPLLRVCVHGVCVFTAVCVHLGWDKCRAQIPSVGHHTWSYVQSCFQITSTLNRELIAIQLKKTPPENIFISLTTYLQCKQKHAVNTHNTTKHRNTLKIRTMRPNTEKCCKYSQCNQIQKSAANTQKTDEIHVSVFVCIVSICSIFLNLVAL